MVRALLVALAVLSGARACDPPIFVASPSATAPGLFPPGNRFCALQRPCHLPLFARDAEGAAESGILAILWAASPEGEFSGGGGMLRIDGAECSGNGSLACIFQPQGDLLNLEAPATLTRCFAVERVSGGGGVCRSPTVCLDIFIEESSAEERVSLDLHSHAEVAIAAAGGDAGCAAVPPDERVPIVRLAWTSALSASEASPALIQHSLDGGASFSDVPAVCVSGSTAVVPAAILLAHAGAPSVELVFRVVVATPTGRRFGLQSNAVFLRRREARAGTLFGATWEGQVMRAHRRGGEGGEVGELAQVLSAPVMKGAFAVDALNQRVYALVHDVDGDADAPPTLVGIDGRLGHEGALLSTELTPLGASTLWNAEVDSRQQLVVVIRNNASGATLVALSLPDAAVALEEPLDSPVQFGVSAMDTRASVYYFVSVASAEVRGFSLSARDWVPAIPLSSLLAAAPDAVLAMAFDSVAGHLYLVAGAWEQYEQRPPRILVIGASSRVLLREIPTPLGASDMKFAHFAIDFSMHTLFIASQTGALMSYDWDSETANHAHPPFPHNLVDFRLAEDTVPVLLAMHPSRIPAEVPSTVTLTGYNFGLSDTDGTAYIHSLPCNSSTWLSDRAVVCYLNPVPDVLRGNSFEAGFRATPQQPPTRWDSVGGYAPDSWTGAAPLSGLVALGGDQVVTVSGTGFISPAGYRAAIELGEVLYLSAPPISGTDTRLVFDIPTLLTPAGLGNLTLLYGAGTAPQAGPSREVFRVATTPVNMLLEEAFGVLSFSSASAFGGGELLIPGLGFTPPDPDGATRADYKCRFDREEVVLEGEVANMAVTNAAAASPQLLSCPVPRWVFAHGEVAFSVLKNGIPVTHGEYGVGQATSVPFTFTHAWSSLAPTRGSISGGTRILIAGVGFDQAQEYVCVLSGTGPGAGSATLQASVLGAARIRCETTQAAGIAVGLAASVSLRMGGVTVPHTGATFGFEFHPAWVSLTPGFASAIGGTPVTATGIGLDTTLTYRCVFSIGENAETAPATAVSSTAVTCLVPRWNYPLGSGTVVIQGVNAQDEVVVYDLVGTGVPAAFTFALRDAISAILPLQAYARERTRFTLAGVGLDPAATGYQCVFSAQGGEGRTVTVAASAMNASALLCVVEAWPFEHDMALVTVLDGGTAVVLLAPLSVSFLESFSSISPSSIPASGGTLSLYGAGFAPGGNYTCDISLGGTLILQTIATAVNLTLIECPITSWPGAHGKASVALSFLPPAGNAERPVASFGDRSLDVTDLLESISQDTASALGGFSLTANGWGFSPSSAYTLHLRSSSTSPSSSPDASAPCTFLRHTALSCAVLRWPSPAGVASVTLSSSSSSSTRTLPGRASLLFTASLSGPLSPLAAGAGSPVPLSIPGVGLDPAGAYECAFTLTGDSSASARTPGVATTPGLLTCASPVWPLPAAPVLLTVLNISGAAGGGGGGVLVPGPELELVLRAEARLLDPPRGPLQGTTVTVVGVGFDPAHTYRCVITGGGASAAVQVLNQTHVECALPARATGDKNVQVVLEDTTLASPTLGSLSFLYEEGFLAITPSAVPAEGGTLLSVQGRGFEPGRAYRCVFTSPSGSRVVSESATVLGDGAISVLAPRWSFPAAVVQVTLHIDGADSNAGGSLSLRYDQLVASALPDSGLVFGAYLVLHGYGFRNERSRYVCQLRAAKGSAGVVSEGLSEALVLNGTVLDPGGGARLSTSLECSLPKWPYPEMATEVFLMFDEVEVAIRGARPAFLLISAWTAVQMQPSYSYVGGGSVMIIGGGFSTSNRKYTCGWSSSSAGGSCGHNTGTPCLEASSSATTLPEALRGPYAAETWGTLRCYLPAWLHPNDEVLMRVYANDVPLEKLSVVPSLPLTQIDSAPAIQTPSSSTNGNFKGGALLTITGHDFGLVDLSQRVRVGYTACEASGWVSETSLKCRLPRGENSKTFGASVTVGPYHVGFTSEYFTYDGPIVYGVAPLAPLPGGGWARLNTSGHVAVGNAGGSGRGVLQVTGRYFRASLQARLGGSSCEQSEWESDSSARCLVPREGGVGGGHVVVMTVSESRGTRPAFLSYDLPTINRNISSSHNTPSSRAPPLLIPGANMGLASYSPRLRASGTAAASTVWVAVSAVRARASPGAGGSLRVTVTVGGQAGSATQLLSYDLPRVLVSWNAPTHAGISKAQDGRKLAVHGLGFGVFSVSHQTRVGVTAAETSVWMSDTSVRAQVASGVAGTLRVVVTAGVQSATAPHAASYDAPTASSLHNVIDEGLRFEHSPFSPSGVGVVMQRTHWEGHDDPRAKRATPSSWVSCGDGGVSCQQLLARINQAYPPGVPASSIMLQQGPSFPQDAIPVSQLGERVEGTVLVYSPPSWNERAVLPHYSVGEMEWPDVFFVASLISFDDDWVGVSVYYHDEDNYIRFEMNNLFPARRLKRRIKGVMEMLWSEPNSPGYEMGEFYTIRVRVLQGLITVYVDAGHDAVAAEASWTRVCGTTPSLGFTCTAALDATQTPGAVALFESGGKSVHFFNIHLYRDEALARHANFPTTGGHALTVRGASLGPWGASPAARMEGSASETTAWLSDTAVFLRVPAGRAQGTMRAAITVGVRFGTVSEMVSYDGVLVALLPPTSRNQAFGTQGLAVNMSQGEYRMQPLGSNMGSSDFSGTARFGSTECVATLWLSDTSMAGKVGAGLGGTLRVAVTMGSRPGTVTEAVSYDVFSGFALEFGNIPWATSDWVVTVNRTFQTADYSVGLRVGHTSCESSKWLSSAEVTCLFAVGTKGTLRLAVTAGMQVGTLTEAFSYDFAWGHKVTRSNAVDGIARHVTLTGANLGLAVVYTASARTGGTACEATIWESVEKISCPVPRGAGGSKVVAVTVGEVAASLIEALSYDAPAAALLSPTSPLTIYHGGDNVTLSGTAFGTSSASPEVRIGGAASEATAWVSWSSVHARVAGGVGGTLGVAITVGGQVGTVTEALSYSGIENLNHVVASMSNAVDAGGRLVMLSGAELSLAVGYSASARTGGTACEETAWESVDQIACRVPRGSRGSMRVAVTVGQRPASLTEALSYDAPALAHLSPSPFLTLAGGDTVTMSGTAFGASSASLEVRIGNTACEATAWASWSSVYARNAGGVGGSLRVAITVGEQAGTVTEALSYAGLEKLLGGWTITVPTLSVPQSPSELTILEDSSAKLGRYTAEARVGSTACEASVWKSITSLACYTPSGVSTNHRSMVTVGERASSSPSNVLDYLSPILQPGPSSNAATLGASNATSLTGQHFAPFDSSVSAWVGRTACAAVEWHSDSQVVCLVSPGIGNSIDILLDIAGSLGTLSAGFSFDIPQVSDLTSMHGAVASWTIPAWGGDWFGGETLTVLGSGFGDADYSPEVYIANLACEVTRWVSDGEVVCEGTPWPLYGDDGFDFNDCDANDCVMNHQVEVEVGLQNVVISQEMIYSCPCDAGSLMCLEAQLDKGVFLPKCKDVDECTGGYVGLGSPQWQNCDATLATCTNTFGSFYCTCITGYIDEVSYGTDCINRDECKLGEDDCGPDYFCVDNEGSFTCECKSGTCPSSTECFTVGTETMAPPFVVFSSYRSKVDLAVDLPRPFYNFTDPRLDAPQVDGITGWAADPVGWNTAFLQWMYMDLGSVRAVKGVETQGGMDESGPPGVWTTFFYVRAWNGSAWIGVDDSATFTGNVDADTHVVNDFAGVVYTRYIQILPTETNVGLSVQVMLRAGVRFGPAPGDCSLAVLDCPAGETATFDGSGWVCTGCLVGSAKAGTGPQPCSACEPWDEASSCPSAQQCYNFLETYDTAHDMSGSIMGFDWPSIDDSFGWSEDADISKDAPGTHFVTLDTGSPRAIVGVVTQGEGFDETYFTTSFSVEWSLDGASWTPVDGGTEFPGNSDGDSKLYTYFATAVDAQFIKIVPVTWDFTFVEAVSLRAGVLFEQGGACTACDAGSGYQVASGCAECADGSYKATAGVGACAPCGEGYLSCPTRTGCYQDVTLTYAPPLVTFSSHRAEADLGALPSPFYNFTDPRLDAPLVDGITGWAADPVGWDTAFLQWMEIDLGSVRAVKGVVTQGGTDEFEEVWTKSFRVDWWDGADWIGVDDSATFVGNVDADTRVINDFAGVVYAQKITIYPLTTNVGLDAKVMLRAGVRLGDAVTECALAVPDCPAGETATFDGSGWVCTGCPVGSAKAGTGPQPCSACEPWDEASSCPSAHQCYNFLETYDTVHDWSDFILFDGFDFNNPALDGQIGWSFPHDPDLDSPGDHWITLDTGSPPRAIVGVVTQGEGYDETYFTTSFSVEWSVDGASWTPVDGGAEFPGNSDGDSKLYTYFATAVAARFIKIFAWSSDPLANAVSLRVGVLFEQVGACS